MGWMRARGNGWFERRTWDVVVDLDVLLTLKREQTQCVSVVLPARNEAGTIGDIVRAVCRDLVPIGLVDEVLVVDSHSADDTAAVARAAGAAVVRQGDGLPQLGERRGKRGGGWEGE